ncbi:MAG: antitoxin VbhA family protein [Clostridia bacterium]|nr:antitoxin VbhA family protein [Clostridia bacterium]
MSIDKAVENAISSVKMEGYKINSDCVDFCKKLLGNEISLEQYIAIVKQKSGDLL